MERRTMGIIATLVSIILCACPGLFLCAFSVFGIANVPFDYTVNGVPYRLTSPSWLGIILLCLAAILILIPILIGFFTLRSRPSTPVPAPYSPPPPPPGPDEPLPPAI